MRLPTLPLVVTALAAVGLYAMRQKPRFIGDLAEVGDDVAVPIQSLTLGGGVQLPAIGAAFAVVRVKGQDADRVQGTVIDLAGADGGKLPLPEAVRTALGVQTLPRSVVTAVYRKGVTLKLEG